MQTAIITGPSVPDIAPAGDRLSTRSGEGFAQYFELAGQTPPVGKDPALRGQPPGAPTEDVDSGMPGEDEIEPGQVSDPETGPPADTLIAGETGVSDHTTAGLSDKSPENPLSERPQPSDQQPLALQSREGNVDGFAPLNMPETGRSNPSATTLEPSQSQGGNVQGRLQDDRATTVGAGAMRGTSESEDRAAPRLPFSSESLPVANRSQPTDRAMPAGWMLDTARPVKTGISEDPQIALRHAASAARNPAGAGPELPGFSGPSDGRIQSVATPQQGVAMVNPPLQHPMLATVAQLPTSVASSAERALWAGANMSDTPGRPGLPLVPEVPVAGAATVPSNQLAMGVNQPGHTPIGAVESAALLRTLSQQISDPDAEPGGGLLPSHPKPAGQTAPTQSFEAFLARPETARLVAAQMADALISAQNNKVGIALNPEELGRVRMVLTKTDAGVAVSITAERPETLDLMRRHIDLLAEEFRGLGFSDIGFEFTQGDAQGPFDNESSDNPQKGPMQSASDPDLTEPTPLPPARVIPTRGLDLRL